jgi:hypothetical protein
MSGPKDPKDPAEQLAMNIIADNCGIEDVSDWEDLEKKELEDTENDDDE